MTNSLHVRTLAIDQQVHRELLDALRSLSALPSRSVIAIRSSVMRPFARHRRRREDTAIVESHTHVAVRREHSFARTSGGKPDQITFDCLLIHEMSLLRLCVCA